MQTTPKPHYSDHRTTKKSEVGQAWLPSVRTPCSSLRQSQVNQGVNLPVARWFDLIGDPAYADAILDRLVRNAHRFENPCAKTPSPKPLDPIE